MVIHNDLHYVINHMKNTVNKEYSYWKSQSTFKLNYEKKKLMVGLNKI